jgi:hypothetical protein
MKSLLAFFRPLRSIAQELKILRELYELDLGSRNPPLYRFTEKPNQKDTEVMYTGMVDKRPPWKKALGWDQEDEPE